jgi:hypothetical protein
LIPALGHLLADDARHEIGAAAWRETDHHTDRFRWVLLGAGAHCKSCKQ